MHLFSFVLRLQTSAICDDYAQQREQTSGVGGKTDGKISGKASKLKAGKSGHSSASKSIKSKVRKIDFTDYDSFTFFSRKLLQTLSVRIDLISSARQRVKRNQALNWIIAKKYAYDVGGIIPSTRSLPVQEKQAPSKSKAKSSKADPKASKDITPSAKAASSGSKRKLPPEPLAQVCYCDVFHFCVY